MPEDKNRTIFRNTRKFQDDGHDQNNSQVCCYTPSTEILRPSRLCDPCNFVSQRVTNYDRNFEQIPCSVLVQF